MYLLYLVILSLIILESYCVLKNFNIPSINFTKKSENNSENYEEMTSDVSFEKNMEPGKLYTDEDYNLFIINNNKTILVKKNTHYEIDEPFVLKYININEKMIKYYYKCT